MILALLIPTQAKSLKERRFIMSSSQKMMKIRLLNTAIHAALAFLKTAYLFLSAHLMALHLSLKRLLKGFFIGLLVFTVSVNVSAADNSITCKWAWFDTQSTTSSYSECISVNGYQVQFISGYTGAKFYTIEFPTANIKPGTYYIFDIYLGGSAVTKPSDGFVNSYCEYIWWANTIYNSSSSNGIQLYHSNKNTPAIPYLGDPVESYGFNVTYSAEGSGSVQIQLICKGESLLYDSTGYAGIAFYLGEGWINSHNNLVVLNSITAALSPDSAPDTARIIESIGNATQEIVNSIESGNSTITGTIIQQNQELISIIQGDPVDTSKEKALESLVGDHSIIEDQINDQLNVFKGQQVEINGNIYSLSLDDNSFNVLKNAYSGYLENFDHNILKSGEIFRLTLESFMSIFAIFVFFPLIIGLVAALLGRYKE